MSKPAQFDFCFPAEPFALQVATATDGERICQEQATRAADKAESAKLQTTLERYRTVRVLKFRPTHRDGLCSGEQVPVPTGTAVVQVKERTANDSRWLCQVDHHGIELWAWLNAEDLELV
jgi:hypothetical protein